MKKLKMKKQSLIEFTKLMHQVDDLRLEMMSLEECCRIELDGLRRDIQYFKWILREIEVQYESKK